MSVMRRRDFLGIFLWAITWAAAILAAGAFGDQHHDARRAVADAAAVVTIGGLAALGARCAKRHKAGFCAAVLAWLATRKRVAEIAARQAEIAAEVAAHKVQCSGNAEAVRRLALVTEVPVPPEVAADAATQPILRVVAGG